MPTLFEVALIMVIVAGFFASFKFLGKWFPPFPKLNEWPINAIIFEQRANMKIPRVEKARSVKTRQGDWYFELKRTGLKTAPKKLKDIYSDVHARNFIFLRQLTRDSVVPAELIHEDEENAVKLRLEAEETAQWERYRYRETVRKHTKGPGMLQMYLPIGMVVVALVGVAIYFTIITKPMLDAAAVMQGSTAVLAEASNNLARAVNLISGA